MTSSWSALEPWDKLSQWVDAAPEMAPQILAMAREVSQQRLAHEQAALHQRMQQEGLDAEHRRQIETREAEHFEKMDVRFWYIQCGSLGLSFLSLVLLAIIAVKFGANAALPALALTGVNGGVAAAGVLVSNNVRKAWQGRRTPPGRDEAGRIESETGSGTKKADS